MSNEFYSPDLGTDRDSPFSRDADGKLVRRAFWLDMGDRSVVLAMTQGIGAHTSSIRSAPTSATSGADI